MAAVSNRRAGLPSASAIAEYVATLQDVVADQRVVPHVAFFEPAAGVSHVMVCFCWRERDAAGALRPVAPCVVYALTFVGGDLRGLLAVSTRPRASLLDTDRYVTVCWVGGGLTLGPHPLGGKHAPPPIPGLSAEYPDPVVAPLQDADLDAAIARLARAYPDHVVAHTRSVVLRDGITGETVWLVAACCHAGAPARLLAANVHSFVGGHVCVEIDVLLPTDAVYVHADGTLSVYSSAGTSYHVRGDDAELQAFVRRLFSGGSAHADTRQPALAQ